MKKLEKARLVVKDLKTLNFTADDYTLKHPEGKYEVWISNGFWFCALYKINKERVFDNQNISKFGIIGKILVWWECRRVLNRIKEAELKKEQEKLNKIFNKGEVK